jgi:CDP-diacylglycerol---glycerol-3-phosphate 3-phosphatidyltransferase
MATTTTPPPRPAVLNLPNVLTLSRLGLAAVLFVCIAYEAWFWGLVVFGLAALSDWFDGLLARRWNMMSDLGRNLDPLIDKVLVCGAFIFLIPVAESRLTPWMVTVVVGRELLITGVRGLMERQGEKFGADWLGKAKMILQCAVLVGILLILSLRQWTWAEPFVPLLTWTYLALLWIMLAVTVLSGVQYLWRAVGLLKS